MPAYTEYVVVLINSCLSNGSNSFQEFAAVAVVVVAAAALNYFCFQKLSIISPHPKSK